MSSLVHAHEDMEGEEPHDARAPGPHVSAAHRRVRDHHQRVGPPCGCSSRHRTSWFSCDPARPHAWVRGGGAPHREPGAGATPHHHPGRGDRRCTRPCGHHRHRSVRGRQPRLGGVRGAEALRHPTRQRLQPPRSEPVRISASVHRSPGRRCSSPSRSCCSGWTTSNWLDHFPSRRTTRACSIYASASCRSASPPSRGRRSDGGCRAGSRGSESLARRPPSRAESQCSPSRRSSSRYWPMSVVTSPGSSSGAWWQLW